MLFHAVLFNFKQNVSLEKREEILAAARRALPAIPGVKHLLAGRNINPGPGYEYAITMYFMDARALEEYRKHPDHVRFRDTEFFPFVDSKQGIDYTD